VDRLLSLVTTTFISLAGFYFVKNTTERDRETGVGQIIAATPVSKLTYVLGKMHSNFAVLSLMMVILAASGIVMQLVRGEDRHIELWKLLAPFLLLALPATTVVAALALLFEAIPFLRGGLGNIVYFFVWIGGVSLPLAANTHTLDLLGTFVVADSGMNAAHLPFQNNGFQFDLGYFDYPLSTFRWEGITWTAEMVISRLIWLGFSLVLVALSAILFDRFDTSGGNPVHETQNSEKRVVERPVSRTGIDLLTRSDHNRNFEISRRFAEGIHFFAWNGDTVIPELREDLFRRSVFPQCRAGTHIEPAG
jgi:hypothetical protein